MMRGIPRLDRRIVIVLAGEGSRSQTGRFVPGAEVRLDVWASRDDQDSDRNVEMGGARPLAERRYFCRWRGDLATVDPTRVEVEDEGLPYPALGILEHQAEGRFRRRWMMISTKGRFEGQV